MDVFDERCVSEQAESRSVEPIRQLVVKPQVGDVSGRVHQDLVVVRVEVLLEADDVLRDAAQPGILNSMTAPFFFFLVLFFCGWSHDTMPSMIAFAGQRVIISISQRCVGEPCF